MAAESTWGKNGQRRGATSVTLPAPQRFLSAARVAASCPAAGARGAVGLGAGALQVGGGPFPQKGGRGGGGAGVGAPAGQAWGKRGGGGGPAVAVAPQVGRHAVGETMKSQPLHDDVPGIGEV